MGAHRPGAGAPRRTRDGPPDGGGTGRLRRRRDFRALRRASRPVRSRLLTLRSRPNGLGRSRAGYAVGRPVGGAVVRNRVRRRLRELVRSLPLASGYDLVVAANPASANASFREIGDALAACARRSGVLAGENR